MKVICNKPLAGFAAALMLALAPLAKGAIVSPITGWAVHNGTSTVGGTASAPTFTPGDNLTLMAPFDDIELAADGDYVEVRTTLQLNNRTANTGTNALNTQLRLGIFDGPAGAIVVNDTPNYGFTIEYANTGGLIREQENTPVQANPFTSPTSRGTGTTNSGNIVGANPPPVTFVIRMTRNGGALDLTGSINSSTYSGSFADSGNSSAHFPLNGAFNFNRIGLFLGPNVDGTSAELTNSAVETNVPEPATCVLAATAAIACVTMGRRRRR